MSNVPGIVPNILNNLVSTGASPARAVAIIGHRDTADVLFPSDTLFYDGTDKGIIKNFASLGDWLTLLGSLSAVGFVDGVQDDGATVAAITPHSPKDSLLYALALAYLANPSLNVYVGILDGNSAGFVGNDTTTLTAGAADALTDLLLYDDIGYLALAGFDPVAEGKSHAETATNSTSPAYNMPRFYVAGLDLFKVFDGVTYASAGKPLDATNDLANVGAAWIAAKSDFGLSINYIGNHDYDFTVIGDTTLRQIGGQLAAAYVAGFLATQKESAGITFSANSLGSTRFTPSNTDNTSIPYPFSLNEINEAIGDGWLITRFAQNTFVFAKGINYISAAGTSWSLYPHRSITNFLHKSLADNLQQFLGRQQTQANLIAAQKLAEGILGDAVSRSYISDINSVRVRPHPTEVDAIIAEVEFITVKPINKIYLNITVS
ncbi:hypothetical protein LCGC14_1173140 [marine sediment metagenome]|uniref:Uncharacterized protein n=1 Tax=marine sediment metagenome TaxID=412755 RepID=A0A0F9P7B7_9ZZZZ